MWSIETEAPDPDHCDVHWAYDTATFTCRECPFLLITEPIPETDGVLRISYPSLLHTMVSIMRSLVEEEDPEDADADADIVFDADTTLPEGHRHRPDALWILSLRPLWVRGKGPRWEVAEVTWIPRPED